VKTHTWCTSHQHPPTTAPPPFLSHSGFLSFTLQTREVRWGLGLNGLSARLLQLVFMERLANFLFHEGILKVEVLLVHPHPATTHIPKPSFTEMSWGNRGRAEETHRKCVCVQMIRWMWVHVWDIFTVWACVEEACVCASQSADVLTCERETRYVRFK